MPTHTYTLAECEHQAKEARERARRHCNLLPYLGRDQHEAAVRFSNVLASDAKRWERRAAALRAQGAATHES